MFLTPARSCRTTEGQHPGSGFKASRLERALKSSKPNAEIPSKKGKQHPEASVSNEYTKGQEFYENVKVAQGSLAKKENYFP